MTNFLFDFFRDRFPADLDKPFLEEADGQILSYAALLARSGALAYRLIELGVRPGDRVAAQVEKSVEMLLLYFATVRAGGVFLPLNTAYTPSELAHFLSDASPRLFVCRPETEADLTPVAISAGVSEVRTLGADRNGSLIGGVVADVSDFTDTPRGPEDLAAILYTSGTTGRSKGAMLTHRNLQSNADVVSAYWRFTAEDRLLHALPIFHTHGLFVATNSVLATGGAMLFLTRFDVREVLRLLPRATAMMGVPTFYIRLLQEAGFTRELVEHMRLFISGSAPLSAEIHRTFTERTGHAILERYGMTETNMNTSNPYDGERVPGSVGFPLPGVDLRIVDQADGKPITEGVGMIEVRGPNVFKGYWQLPERTAEEFRPDGFFITGDLGTIDTRGYVFIAGRGKDLIISGGFNVYPAEVENAIDAITGIAESAVIGVPHPDFGEAVVAIVRGQPGGGTTEDTVLAALQTELARFKQPKRVIFIPDLPRNAMGKIQKKALREEYAGLFA